jgi:hypothetical protein
MNSKRSQVIRIALAIGTLLVASSRSNFAATISIDFDERPGSGLTLPGFTPFLIDSVGGATAIQTGDSVHPSLPVTLQNVGPTSAGYDDRVRATPTNSGAFTQTELMRDFVFSRQGVNLGLNVHVTGLVPFGVYQGSIWSFDSGSTGTRVSDWFANGATVRNNYTFGGAALPTTDDQYRMDFSVVASDTGEVTLKGRRDALSVNAAAPPVSDFGVFINGFELDEVGTLLVDPDPVLSVEFGGGAAMPGFEQMPLANNGQPLPLSGKTVTLSAIGTSLQERNRTAPMNNGVFTHQAILQDFIFATTGAVDTTGMEVRIDGLTPGQQYYATLWSYDASSTQPRGSNWLGDGAPVPYQFAGEAAPRTNEDYRFSLTATADVNGTLLLSGLKSADGIDNHAVFLNALELRPVIPEPSTWALVVLAAAGAMVWRRRRG